MRSQGWNRTDLQRVTSALRMLETATSVPSGLLAPINSDRMIGRGIAELCLAPPQSRPDLGKRAKRCPTIQEASKDQSRGAESSARRPFPASTRQPLLKTTSGN